MSFQGIRKIRQSRRESPLLFESKQIDTNMIIKPRQFTFDLKLSNIGHDIRTTRDSEIKIQSARQTKNNSFNNTSSSKDKNKKIQIGNFLHINYDGLRSIKLSKEFKKYPEADMSRTQRGSIYKNHTNQLQRESREIKRVIELNCFELDFVVGKGGFGKVWKVREKATNKIYAMKQMQKVKIIQKRSVHSVMNEKVLLQKMKNTFLVNMVYSFQNREHLFLVMDYCNRGDLRYHLGNRRKFKEQQTRFFLACIVSSLEYLHGKKVIHRDLKPQNLVIDDKGYLRVTDLGVSRQVKLNNAEDTSGTPGYMAPEVICKMNHSYPVDFFALGVMAYQFMTGKRPYIGANRKEIREKILAKQIQLDQIPPFGWSRESVDFINRLIQRKPENRLGTKGIQQVKCHPFFKKMDWIKLQHKKIIPPFLPASIEEDYSNYKQCISQDTQIKDIQQYKMILRHKDTQQAFTGYEHNIISNNSTLKRKSQIRQNNSFIHTTFNLKK